MTPQPPMGNGVDDRRTPADLFKRYDDRYHFTLDAAASHENALCDLYCTLEGTFDRLTPPANYPICISGFDGLAFSWQFERVFINPPYGRGLLAPFVEKAHHEARVNGATVVMLLPVRTEQPWFQEVVWPDVEAGRARIEWCKGRLRFSGLAAAPFPSMVVIWNA